MNSRHDQPTNLSQQDADFLSHLTHLAESIEPDPTFKAQLEAELLQTHQRVNRMNFSLGRLNCRASILACVSLATAAVFVIPTMTSGQISEWFSAFLYSTVDTKANAQTIAQLIETGEMTITSDAQDYDESTKKVRAIGNATWAYPKAQIQASANEIRYVLTGRQVVLSGNVQISQRGERLQGKRAICSLEQKQCNLSQE
ncbi:LptA/OstA family protein [Nostoc sp. MG11]|uniref:LptA/OstA family protein n=1 Tax=Nostoc sp. MG11 TaxID=2721166 RepID=UPI0018694BEB|nr:LptA/OstA family protein [Nostoc sp. MG11]